MYPVCAVDDNGTYQTICTELNDLDRLKERENLNFYSCGCCTFGEDSPPWFCQDGGGGGGNDAISSMGFFIIDREESGDDEEDEEEAYTPNARNRRLVRSNRSNRSSRGRRNGRPPKGT